MSKEKKYKSLTKLLLNRLIITEREVTDMLETFEKVDSSIRIFTEMDAIVPIIEIIDILGVSEDKEEDIFSNMSEMINIKNNNQLNKTIDEFLEKNI